MKRALRMFFVTLAVFFEDYFLQGWRFFQLQHQELIEGFWNKSVRPPHWFAQWFFSLVLLPLAVQWGIAINDLSFWWGVVVVVVCHLSYCALYMVQDVTASEFWMFIQDVVGRFLWQILHVALIVMAAKWLLSLIF